MAVQKTYAAIFASINLRFDGRISKKSPDSRGFFVAVAVTAQ